MSTKNGKSKNGNGNGHKDPWGKRETPTPKQAMFIEYYLANGQNATEAARQAGFTGSDETLRVIGYQLVNKHHLRERIAERVAEAGVTSDAVIGTLASHLTSDVTDLLDEFGRVDLELIRAKKLGHLIKKIKTRRFVLRPENEAVEVMELELYSAQNAATQLCKVLGIERAPLGNPADDKARVERAIQAWLDDCPGATREDAVRYLGREMPEVEQLGRIG